MNQVKDESAYAENLHLEDTTRNLQQSRITVQQYLEDDLIQQPVAQNISDVKHDITDEK